MSDNLIDPYTKLKNAVIARFGASQDQKVRQILGSEEIGTANLLNFYAIYGV